MIREREGRSAVMGDAPELANLRLVASRRTFGKALELHHPLAELRVAWLWTRRRENPPQPPSPRKVDPEVGPGSIFNF